MSNEYEESDRVLDGIGGPERSPMTPGKSTPRRAVMLLVEQGDGKPPAMQRVPVGGLVEIDGKLYQLTQRRVDFEGDIMAELVASIFEHDAGDHFHCINCGASTVDYPELVEHDEHESFGSTTEGHERCTQCGIVRGFADLSAVI